MSVEKLLAWNETSANQMGAFLGEKIKDCDIGDIMEFIPDDDGKEVPALPARPQKKTPPVPKSGKL